MSGVTSLRSLDEQYSKIFIISTLPDINLYGGGIGDLGGRGEKGLAKSPRSRGDIITRKRLRSDDDEDFSAALGFLYPAEAGRSLAPVEITPVGIYGSELHESRSTVRSFRLEFWLRNEAFKPIEAGITQRRNLQAKRSIRVVVRAATRGAPTSMHLREKISPLRLARSRVVFRRDTRVYKITASPDC